MIKLKYIVKGKGRRFIRRRVERVEKAYWELILFMFNLYELFDVCCEDVMKVL